MYFGDFSESVWGTELRQELFLLALGKRVYAFPQLLPGFITPAAGLGKANFGVSSESKALLLPQMAILETPKLLSRRDGLRCTDPARRRVYRYDLAA